MIPTFVIGLREGLEAALIVGIIAAFLDKNGRRDAIKWIWAGIISAVALCALGAWGLILLERELPQVAQERFETIIALVAVVMVTYMVLWMRSNARAMKGKLEYETRKAIGEGSVLALVLMAFFAVLREGMETAVFLFAVFQSTGTTLAAKFGVVLGVGIAAAFGYAIYKGVMKVNLSKVFRITGVILVLVAAGLVSSAIHTAHEAGWVNFMQQQTLDLSAVIRPGSISSALITGVFGIQPQPVLAEVVGWVLYAVPMLFVVLWPAGVKLSFFKMRSSKIGIYGAILSIVIAVLLVGGCSAKKENAKKENTKNVRSDQALFEVKLQKKGCTPEQISAVEGPATFHVTNVDANNVSEWEITKGDRIIGEKENLAPGLDGNFSLTLKKGVYDLRCGTTKYGTLTVTSGSKGAAEVKELDDDKLKAVNDYESWVSGQVNELSKQVNKLREAITAGDVEKAKALYIAARPAYEKIEPVAESFGNLDPKIDARVNDVEPGDKWTGFHVIEQGLWVKSSTNGLLAVADQLVKDIDDLAKKSKNLDLDPARIANGSVELLDEVSKSKITGEEERYSHTDLVDVQANVDGSRKAFEFLQPLLASKDKALVKKIDERFNALQKILNEFRVGNSFKAYDELSKGDTKRLAQAVDAVASPLATVSSKVA